MSGQRSADSEGGAAASVAPGCSLRETPRLERRSAPSFLLGDATGAGSGGGLAVFTWGRGEDGQLGLGDASDQDEPTYVDALRGVGVRQIACGSGHTVVLTTEGHVYTWGRGDDGRLGHGENMWKYVPRHVTASLLHQTVQEVTCGSYHTAAVTTAGDLYTWGGGMYGKLGHGNEAGASSPKRVEALVGVAVTQIACGSRHTAVVTATGMVYTWGDKENGVTGHGDVVVGAGGGAAGGGGNGGAEPQQPQQQQQNQQQHQYAPKRLERLANKKVQQISACGFHTAVVTDQGELYTWGEGKFGRLGHFSERNCHSPQLVESMAGKKPRQVSCGGFHTAVVTEDGRLYTFGGGEHGQLGHNDRVNKLRPTLVQALEGNFVTQITCGWSHSVALTAKGQVYTWGNGDHGKLGHGSGRKVSVPHVVDKLSDYRVVRVASYNEHTAALVEPSFDNQHYLGGGVRGVGEAIVPVTTTFRQEMKAMVNDEEFSDVTFWIEDGPVYAHRAILAQRCEPFAAMFRSGMRESSEKVIPLPNVRKPVFLLLLEYLYTDTLNIKDDSMDYDLTSSTSKDRSEVGERTTNEENGVAVASSAGGNNTPTSSSATLLMVELYITADLYDCKRLADLCLATVRRNLRAENAGPLLQTAADHHCQVLKDLIMAFVVEHFDKVSKTQGIQHVSHSLLLEILSQR